MVVVLRDHVAQRAAPHLLKYIVADSGAAPGNLFPYEDAEAIAVLQYAARLLVVRKTDEVCANLLDELHLLIEKVVRYRGGVAGMVFVAMRAAQKEAFAVELERAVLHPLGVANAEALLRDGFGNGSGLERNAALVEMRVGGAPEMGFVDGEGSDVG